LKTLILNLGQIDLLADEIHKNSKNLESFSDTDFWENDFWDDEEEDDYFKIRKTKNPDNKSKRISYDYNASNLAKVRNAYQ